MADRFVSGPLAHGPDTERSALTPAGLEVEHMCAEKVRECLLTGQLNGHIDAAAGRKGSCDVSEDARTVSGHLIRHDQEDMNAYQRGYVSEYGRTKGWWRMSSDGPPVDAVDLLNRIKEVAEPDGSWPGAEVVDVLTGWFAEQGLSV